MPDPADVLTRIERFNQSKGGGVLIDHRGGGYTLRLAATGAPIARLKATGPDDSMQVFYWSHRGKWSETGPMGGAILPLDEALAFIARDPIFWTWT